MRRFGRTELAIGIGDITKQKTDAIVNAANSSLRGGGGVDGAIHRVGGPTIDRECREYVSEHGALPPGKAMWTHGGNLPARYVIHTVGPIYRSKRESAPILRSAYEESLRLAERLKVSNLSFPSISTGVYGYPLEAAARVALGAIIDYLCEGSRLELVQLVCFTQETFDAYKEALEKLAE
ncbi:O-acetyl-ADP-ribose deacetylase [Candidatus Bipolaricaulota bacterium]|nr:O-acetyl-ADP-ribose deacetylase [Candidatus Bipolaricaulota bacterium]